MATVPMAQSQGHNPEAKIVELQRAIVALQRDRDEEAAERAAAQTREAALAEVLAAINASPADPTPIYDLILGKAHELCGADVGLTVCLRRQGALRASHPQLP